MKKPSLFDIYNEPEAPVILPTAIRKKNTGAVVKAAPVASSAETPKRTRIPVTGPSAPPKIETFQPGANHLTMPKQRVTPRVLPTATPKTTLPKAGAALPSIPPAYQPGQNRLTLPTASQPQARPYQMPLRTDVDQKRVQDAVNRVTGAVPADALPTADRTALTQAGFDFTADASLTPAQIIQKYRILIQAQGVSSKERNRLAKQGIRTMSRLTRERVGQLSAEESMKDPLLKEISDLNSQLYAQQTLGAGMLGFLNGMSLGYMDNPWLAEKIAPESVEGVKRSISTAREAQPTAAMVGDTSGQIVNLVSTSALVGEGTSAIPILQKVPILRNAINSGVTFGLNSGLRTATAGGSLGESLQSGGIGLLGGAAGGAVSGAVGAGMSAGLAKLGLQNSIPAAVVERGLQGAGFAAGNTGATYFLLPEGSRPTKEQVVQDAAVAGLYSMIMGLFEIPGMVRADRARLERGVRTMQEDFQKYSYALNNAASDTERAAMLDSIIKNNGEISDALGKARFLGQQGNVDQVRAALGQMNGVLGEMKAGLYVTPQLPAGTAGASSAPLVPVLPTAGGIAPFTGGTPPVRALPAPPPVQTGAAVWHGAEHDQPITVTGYAGSEGGRSYVTVAESSTAIPQDEITYLPTARADGNLQAGNRQAAAPVVLPTAAEAAAPAPRTLPTARQEDQGYDMVRFDRNEAGELPYAGRFDFNVDRYLDMLQNIETPEDYRTFRDGIKRQMDDLDAIRGEAVDAYADYIYGYRGQGVSLQPTFNETGETVNRIRVSNNEPWYSKYAGRRLSRADARALAERVVDTPRMQADFPEIVPRQTMADIQTLSEMRDELHHFYSSVLSRDDFLGAKQLGDQYSVYYGDPSVAYATPEGYNRIRGKSLKELDIASAPWEEINLSPEIQRARARAKFDEPTISISTPERAELRLEVAEKLYALGSFMGKDPNGKEVFSGPVARGRHADIVIGPPAAGKSSVFANALSRDHQARIIDSDMAKTMLPEFDGGYGAGRVHKESDQIITDLLLPSSTKDGENIVLPLVGKNTGKIRELARNLKAQRYTVNLYLNDLPVDKAARRAVTRFMETGRFVDPDYVLSIGSTPNETYDILRREGLFDEYVKKSNDVARGEPPVLLDQFSNSRDVHLGGLHGLGQGQRQIQAGRVGRNDGGSRNSGPPQAPGAAGTGAPGAGETSRGVAPVSQLSGRYGEERTGRTPAGTFGSLQKVQRRIYEFPGDGGSKARIGFDEIEPAFFSDRQRAMWNTVREKGFTAHFIPSESVVEVEGQRVAIPKGAAFSYPERGLIFADADAPERVVRHEIFHAQTYAQAPAAKKAMRKIALLVDQESPSFRRYEKTVREDFAARGLEATFDDVMEELSAELYGAISEGTQAARRLDGFFQNGGYARAAQIMRDFDRGAPGRANPGGEGPTLAPRLKRYSDVMPMDDGRAASLGDADAPLTRAQLDEIARTGSLTDTDAPAESIGKRIDRILNDPETIPSVDQIASDTDIPAVDFAAKDAEMAAKLTGRGVSITKDFARNFDAASGGDGKVRAWLRENVERPFLKAKAEYAAAVSGKLDDYKDKMDALGIKKGSQESAAVQWYGEGVKVDKFGDPHEYTLDMLKREFPGQWENIVAAEKIHREIYDSYVDSINEAMRRVYPDAEARGEKKLLDLESRIHYIERVKIPETMRDLEIAADPMERARLKDELANFQGYARMMNGQWAKMRAEIDDGTYFIGKRLQKRKDYFHHFREMETGLAGLKNIVSTPADIDPALVGVSDFTEPKSKWTGFMQRRHGGDFKADAVGGMVKYIPAAEYKVHIDPVIAQNRGFIRYLRKGTAELRNANKFIDWMNDWTNDLAGKTNPVDRPLQKIANRQVMAAVDWLNRRVRTNAVLGNVNSAVAQVFNIPNAVGYIKNPVYLTKGAADWGRYLIGNQELSDALGQSGFIRERYLQKSIGQFDEGILKTPQKLAEWMLNVGDEQSTIYIWFSAYEQAKAKNIENPVEYADDITRRSVAGRGIGEVPIMQKAKVTTLFAPFQIEVNNAYQVLKEKFRKKDLAAIFGIFLSTWLMNNLSEKLTGRRISFDPINATIEAAKEANEEEDATAGEKATLIGTRLAGEALSNMPYGSMIAATFVPEDYRSSLFGENDPTRFGTGNMGINALAEPFLQLATGKNPDWLSAAANIVLPWGGKQAERTIKAAQDMKILPRFTDNFDEGAKDLPASYSAGGGFRFPIDTGDPLNVASGLLFGSFSTKEGKNYLASGQKPLSESKTALIKEAAAQGIPANDFLRVYNDLKKFEPIKDENGKTIKSQTEQQMEYLKAADLPADQKAWFNQNLISHIMVIPEESNVDFTSDETYIITQLPESAQELYSHPEVREAVGGAENFVKIRDIYESVKADTDEYGNSISGTAKTKRVAEIASALGVTEQRAGDIYDELFVRKHSMDELGSAARRAYELGLATKNMRAEDYLKYTNVMNTTEGGKEEKIEALMENGLDGKHAEYVYAATHSFAYRLEDLSAKEREKYEQELKPHNMGEWQFLELRNGLSQIKGTKGANGRTISGSQKQNRYQYLIQQGLGPKEARYLLSVMYDYKW